VSTIANGTLAELLPLPRIPAVRGRLRDEPVAGDKRVLLAAPRGYCAGVDRAVIAVEKALEQYGSPVYVRKQIVHNVHVVSTLESQGAIFVDDVDEVPRGANVVFSAHGVAPSVVEAAAERGLQAIDATCPLVSKVHREAARFARDDYQILLIGHAGHEEVAGTMGYAPERTILVDGPADVPDIEVGDPERLVWLSQTTLSVDETMETVRLLRERFPRLQDPPSDDICYATQNRQLAIKKVSSEAELVIVVGSANSSNSMRLVDVALQNGATRAHRIDYASEIQQDWLAGVAIVGVTSGASVPEVLVREVLDALADAGYARVQEVVTAQEDLVFSLPKELRGTSDGARRAAALDGEER
jgi:4-hydroxy-3-methylbut-2-enyl diphosphate reductase